MEKSPEVLSELELKIGGMIREKYIDTLKPDLSPELKTILDEWMDWEIRHLMAATVSIAKIEMRAHSVVFMFGKKFDRVKILIRIMEKHGESENTEMFSELLYLL